MNSTSFQVLSDVGSQLGPVGDAVGVTKSGIPSGKHTKDYGQSQFLIGKSTISMAMFNSYGISWLP